MTSSSPGMKYEHVVAPLPLETWVGVGLSPKAGIVKMRSQPMSPTLAWKTSLSPLEDQYASAFSPPKVSCRRSAR